MPYPPPDQNPKCVCWPNLMAAFFCPTGHMLECHYPMTCSEAECEHYQREMSDDELAAFDDLANERIDPQ